MASDWLIWSVLLITVVPWLSVLLFIIILSRRDGKAIEDLRRIQILVLGDIGRSPRMQYHAISCARNGMHVDLIGYRDSAINPEVASSPNICLCPLKAAPDFLKTENKTLFLLLGPLKVVYQIATLVSVLGWQTDHSGWILVQNPPSIPTLIIAQFLSLVRNSRLVIDWHNFGYSILALKLGSSHRLVRWSKTYEYVMSWNAYAHLCVTNAMTQILRNDYGLTTTVVTLHDRPASIFKNLSDRQRSIFLDRLPSLDICSEAMVKSIKASETRLVISSTSWTPDEDFSILLEALLGYAECASREPSVIPLFVVITGKGPQKILFEAKIKVLENAGRLRPVTIQTFFFDEIGDYAKLLGCADLGVSLHTSSSGVDLPMKVVDMFGAGLPVAGWSKFQAWPELVEEGVNGRGFENASQLTDIMIDLFCNKSSSLAQLKAGAIKEGERRWNEEWNPVVGKLLGLSDQKSHKD